MYDFPFDFTDVCYINNLDTPRKGKSSDINCPFCGGKHKLNVNAAIGKNVARCNRCGWSGGMLKFHADLNGLNTKEAKRDIEKKLNLSPNSIEYQKKTNIVRKVLFEYKEEPEMPVSERSSKYAHMASVLNLSSDHKHNLIQRGLSESFINSRMYRSLPVEDDSLTRLATKMITDGYSVKGLPGFYYNGNNYQLMKLTRGILIPIRDLHNNIEGFQIRKDNDKCQYKTHTNDFTGEIICDNNGKPIKFATNKFCTLSSRPENFKDGGKLHSICHFAGSYVFDDNRNMLIPDIRKNSIKFTEGPLKADIYYHLMGEPMLGVLGVNNVKQLRARLEELLIYYPSITQIEDCFDMDYKTNKNVVKAIDSIKSMADELGLNYVRREWDDRFKGIDDFAFAVKKELY